MLRCGCGMMIECEVKTGQTVESIEHIRREGGQFVGIQGSNGRWLKEEGCGKNGRNRVGRLLSPLKIPEGRDLMEFEWS